MSSIGLEFHFGVTLEASAAQMTYYDAGTATTYNIPIPAGQYFFKHDTSAKDLRTEITAIVQALGFAGFSLTTHDDRQLEWTMDAAGDYINLVNTGDGDDQRLAAALGLYDNNGDLTYFRTNNITDGYVTPNVLCSWFADGGRTYETYDLTGFDVTPTDIYETEGGAVSSAKGTHKGTIGPVRFTGVAGDAVRGGWPYATQAVAGTTLNATWTTSIWRASGEGDPVFYAELGATPDAYGFALRSPLQRTAAKQIQPGWTSNFDLTMDLICLEDLR